MVFLIFLKKFLGISGLPPPAPPKEGWMWGVIFGVMCCFYGNAYFSRITNPRDRGSGILLYIPQVFQS